MKKVVQKGLTGILFVLISGLAAVIPAQAEELNFAKTLIDVPIEYSQTDTNEFQPDGQIYGSFLGRRADSLTAEESGICGEQISWQFADGILNITGSGKMYDYLSTPPWYKLRNEITQIEISEGITYIGEASFYECSDLKTVSLPASLTELGRGAFVRCYELSQITLPAGLTQIQAETFYNCNLLQSISLPDGLKNIGENAFYGCVTLKNIKIPDSVTNIGDGAFYGCTSLKKVKLPAGIKNIGKNTFSKGTKAKNLPDEVSQMEDGSLWKAAKVKINVKESYKAAFEVLKIVNQERKKKKLSALKMDKELLDAAMFRAAEISLYFSHTRPIGTNCFSRSELMHGENIAAGQRNSAEVMNSWMHSPGHKANILNKRWKSIGIGCIELDGRKYWVQCFGEELSSSAKQTSYKDKSKKQTICVEPKYSRKASKISISSARIGIGAAADVQVSWYNQFVTVSIPAEHLEYKITKKSVCKISKGKIKGKKSGSTKVKIWFPGYKKGAVTKKITVG